MSKVCNGCSLNEIKTIPYAAHESAMARAERNLKRLWILIIILVLLLVGTNIAWLVYESGFETVQTAEEYHIEQDVENGNNNSIINGGEIVNGETDNKVQENDQNS